LRAYPRRQEATEKEQMPVKVFISYAHEDQELHKKLRKHLSLLERSGQITIWQDQEILAGEDWENQIDLRLNEADLILLLVSASFIASNYCWNKEVQAALQRHSTGMVRVIPVILRPVHWKEPPLGQLQALPTEAKPVTQWNDHDAALDNVVQGIRHAILPDTAPPPVLPPPPWRWRLPPVRTIRRLALLAGLLILLVSDVWWFRPQPFNLPNDVVAVQAPDGELIGLSDGKYVFYTASPAADLKKQAAQELQQGHTGTAISLLSAAHNQETSDAEVLIYRENIRATSGGNYITIVVGTTLTGTPSAIGIGRDDLQGAYVAQREFNDTAEQHGGFKVRLLIANSGGKTDADTASYTSLVAQQIVGVAQKDKTIVGVMGWDLSPLAFAAFTPLTQNHIPMLSIAAGDNLTGFSKYFFRANAPAALQAKVAAQYSLQTLKATKAAIFVDNASDYSRSLADDFKTNFNGGTIVATESYTVGDSNTEPALLEAKLQDALRHQPDIIYFAGYPADVSILLQRLQPSDPPVVGGNALYELGGYTNVTPAGLSHLRFSALAYPDEWDVLCSNGQSQACSKPSFFTVYPQAFDDGKHQQQPYRYTRSDSGTMLDHDATMAFLQASEHIAKESLTPDKMQQALAGLTGPNALQGAAGQLAFGSDGNPINKAVTIVCNKDGFFKLDVVVGQFLVNGPILTEYPATSVCA
jgi:ABC-type branched-subunit amino acid transport system substrate-binding protein